MCPTDEYVNKTWYIHIMEYFSAPKKKEVNSDTDYNMDEP